MTSLAVSSKSFIREDIVKSASSKREFLRLHRRNHVNLAVNEGKALLVSGTFTNHPTRFISSQNRFC